MAEIIQHDFFRDFNSAFFSGNQEFLSEHVTEDVVWMMVGNEAICGKSAFLDAAFGIGGYKEMTFTIDSIVTGGLEAAAKGTMTTPSENGESKTYAFCDFYTLDKEPGQGGKIKEMVSFVIETK